MSQLMIEGFALTCGGLSAWALFLFLRFVCGRFYREVQGFTDDAVYGRSEFENAVDERVRLESAKALELSRQANEMLDQSMRDRFSSAVIDESGNRYVFESEGRGRFKFAGMIDPPQPA